LTGLSRLRSNVCLLKYVRNYSTLMRAP
jgi:hypothetical protein